DAFVAVLDAAGDHLFSARFGDDVYQSSRAISEDTFGNLLVGGTFAGTIDFGGAPFTSSGDDDIFIAKLSLDGEPRFAKPFGNPGLEDQRVDRIAHDAEGNSILAGTFDGSVNFGGGPRNALAGDDVFIVKLTK